MFQMIGVFAASERSLIRERGASQSVEGCGRFVAPIDAAKRLGTNTRWGHFSVREATGAV
jgi:hypothetical protein